MPVRSRSAGPAILKLANSAPTRCFVDLAKCRPNIDDCAFEVHDGSVSIAAASIVATVQELGLDKSLFQQYVIYLKDLAHGDFGRSFQNRQPVLPQLWEPLKNTLPMLLLSRSSVRS